MKPFYFLLLLLLFDIKDTMSQNIDFRTAVDMMLENNSSVKAADKNTELAARQSQFINASWLPSISLTGNYSIMSNKISVNQEYAPLLEPIKDKFSDEFLVPEIIDLVSNQLGDLSFDFPIMENQFGSIDIELLYPIFTGNKRLYANRLAKKNESLSEINKKSVISTKYLELATIYFSLKLTESVVKTLEENYEMTESHYSQALKMEKVGMFDKAERLVVKVCLDANDRKLNSAENQVFVLRDALYKLIGIDSETNSSDSLKVTTPLFMDENHPQLQWFKDMMYQNSYIFQQSELHEDISDINLKLSRSNYYPIISVIGKQTIASYQIPENLIPNTIVGLNLSWSLFDGLARERNIQMVKIESEMITETQKTLKNDLEIAIEECFANLKQACINAKDLQSSLDLAEEIYRIRKKSFEEGLSTSQQVLDALNLLNDNKLLLLTTYYEYDIALANLCCLCGIPEYFESYITF